MKIFIVIAGNVRSMQSICRLCECFNVDVFFIDKNKRKKNFFGDFQEFLDKFYNHRKILMTPYTKLLINDFKIQNNDVIVFGGDDGFPLEYTKYFHQLLKINMPTNCMALSVEVALGITLQFVI